MAGGIERDAECDHFTTAASRRRNPARASHRFRGQHWPASTRECDLLVGNIFRTNGTESSGRSVTESSVSDPGNTRHSFAAQHAWTTECGDRDSHGVSDPSGQARGHCWRAQRGRSRHGLIPHSDRSTCSGRQRAPPSFADRSGSRACKVLRSNCLRRAVEAQSLALAEGEWTDRHAGRGTTSNLRGRPSGRPQPYASGHVNQGREMEVLA
jgi:hypothetical protein